MPRVRIQLAVLALVAVPLLAVPAGAQDCDPATSYTVTELESVGSPFHITRATAVAADGTTAGSSLDDSLVSHAVRWDSSGQVTTLSAGNGEAFGISTNGVVAGWQAGRRGGLQAMTWAPPKALKPPRGAISARAVDVNATGLAVGWSVDSIGDTDAVRWDGTRATTPGFRPRGAVDQHRRGGEQRRDHRGPGRLRHCTLPPCPEVAGDDHDHVADAGWRFRRRHRDQ